MIDSYKDYSYIRKSISQVYKPTIGADFHSKKLEIMEQDELKTVTLQVIIRSENNYT